MGAGAFPGDAFRFRDGVELEAATQVVCEHVQLLPGAIGGIAFGRHHLMTYALGRRVEYYDMPAVRAIALEAAYNGNRMSSFIFGIVNSAAFQMKKSENTEPTTVVGESGPP